MTTYEIVSLSYGLIALMISIISIISSLIIAYKNKSDEKAKNNYLIIVLVELR